MRRPPLNTLIAYLYVVMVRRAYFLGSHAGMLHNVAAGQEAFNQINLRNLLWKWSYLLHKKWWSMTNDRTTR